MPFITDIVVFAANVGTCFRINPASIMTWLGVWWDKKCCTQDVQVCLLLYSQPIRIPFASHSQPFATIRNHSQEVTVPVSNVTWFLSESQERLLTAFGLAPLPTVSETSTRLYNSMAERTMDTHVLMDSLRGCMFDIIDTMTYMSPTFSTDPNFTHFSRLHQTALLDTARDLSDIKTTAGLLSNLTMAECSSIKPLVDRINYEVDRLVKHLCLDLTDVDMHPTWSTSPIFSPEASWGSDIDD